MSDQERGAGEGRTSQGAQVEPSAAEPELAEDDSGGIAVPLGTPVDAKTLRELKRRAEQPDPHGEAAPTAEDPEQPSL